MLHDEHAQGWWTPGPLSLPVLDTPGGSAAGKGAGDWEAAFAPYDETTYQAALAFLRPEDVVLDLGAGDLRFARRAALRCRRVIAVERQYRLLRGQPARPDNLWLICADALTLRYPPAVTVGVVLMRHCRHLSEYAAGLRAAGARRLITNARWGMNVEEMWLDAPRVAYATVSGRWYACICGGVGFAPGPAELIDQAALEEVVDVSDCPKCLPR